MGVAGTRRTPRARRGADRRRAPTRGGGTAPARPGAAHRRVRGGGRRRHDPPLVVAHLLRFGVSAALLPGPNVPYVLVAALSVPVWLGVLALARCYDRRILGVGSDEYRRVLNGGVHFLAVVALLHFLGRLVIARGYVGVLIPVALVLTLLTRFALRAWLHRQRRRGRYVHRLLLVGTPAHRGRRRRAPRPVGVVRAPARRRLRGRRRPRARDRRAVGARRRRPHRPAAVRRAVAADSVAITSESAPGELRELAASWRAPTSTCSWPRRSRTSSGPARSCATWAGSRCCTWEPAFAGPQRVAKEVIDRLSAALALLIAGAGVPGRRRGRQGSTARARCSSARPGWAATATASR